MELIVSLFKLAYHRTSQNHQAGIQLVHWCQERAITYAWIAKAFEDGFPCQRQLCHCLRSKVMIKTQVYENSICRPESQQMSVGEYWQFKQRFMFSNFHLWEAKI